MVSLIGSNSTTSLVPKEGTPGQNDSHLEAKFCLAKHFSNRVEELQNTNPSDLEIQQLAKKAFPLWNDLSAHPSYHDEAHKYMAMAYCKGLGVEKDFRRGEKMLKKLIKSRSPLQLKPILLQLQQARYHEVMTSKKVFHQMKRDATSFFFWDTQKRNEERYWVGMSYLEGKYVEKDPEQAEIWLESASLKRGHEAARDQLDQMAKNSKAGEKQEKGVPVKRSFLKKAWQWIKMNQLQALGVAVGSAALLATVIAPIACLIFTAIIFPPFWIALAVIALAIGCMALGSMESGSPSVRNQVLALHFATTMASITRR